MKQKLKLALVGAGERGQYCYAPYAKMHGYEIEFVAVADPHKGRREKFVQDYHVPAEGVFETAEQFFARPRMADAVLICTQDSQHYAYACQAIDLGYSILLEKLPNVLLMPHMGGPTVDRRLAVTRSVTQDIRRFLAGQPMSCEISRSYAAKMSAY